MILIEEYKDDECVICEKESDIYIPIIDTTLCKKCAKKLALVIKQELT